MLKRAEPLKAITREARGLFKCEMTIEARKNVLKKDFSVGSLRSDGKFLLFELFLIFPEFPISFEL